MREERVGDLLARRNLERQTLAVPPLFAQLPELRGIDRNNVIALVPEVVKGVGDEAGLYVGCDEAHLCRRHHYIHEVAHPHVAF